MSMNEVLKRVLEEAVVSFNLLDPGCCLEDLRSTTNNNVKTTKFCVTGNSKELINIVPRKSANLTFRSLTIENILISSIYTSQKTHCLYTGETTSE